jgi:hypothetical protein
MKRGGERIAGCPDEFLRIDDIIVVDSPLARRVSQSIHDKYKQFWRNLDENYMQEFFGGAAHPQAAAPSHSSGHYELSQQNDDDDDF